MLKFSSLLPLVVLWGALLVCVNPRISAQTTTFTYQGKLTDGTNVANGNYDFEFKLFVTPTGGVPVGATVALNNVPVAAGIFTVQLNFGANAFPGADRFLEIAVKPAGSGTFTILSPRQSVLATPYAIKSLGAAAADGLSVACVNCVTSGQIASVNGSAVTGAIPVASVPAGSANYLQNTTTQQTTSNFNISGNGTAGGTLSGSIMNATTQYNLSGSRILSNEGSGNLFVGKSAGLANTGFFNAFFGASAGENNTTGVVNSFFGNSAGKLNTQGLGNSFFGFETGVLNTIGEENSFFGARAGSANTTGKNNSFFGSAAGNLNEAGENNTAIGTLAQIVPGLIFNPGNSTAIGAFARVLGNNATAIGSRAQVDATNAMVLGSINGVNSATADTNVGIGTTTPQTRLHIKGAAQALRLQGPSSGNAGGAYIAFYDALGPSGFVGDEALINNATYLGSYVGDVILFPSIGETLRATSTGRVGIGEAAPADKLDVDGDVRIGTSGTNGCLKNNNGGMIIGTCSSDLRFKRGITPFNPVLTRLARLQPVHYFWRAPEFPEKHFGPAREAGLIAQEVEQVLPELVVTDAQGFKAVDYSKLPLLTLQAVKELKAENEALRARLLKLEQAMSTPKRRKRR